MLKWRVSYIKNRDGRRGNQAGVAGTNKFRDRGQVLYLLAFSKAIDYYKTMKNKEIKKFQMVTVDLPVKHYLNLKIEMAKQNKTISYLIRGLIESYLYKKNFKIWIDQLINKDL
jgi:hypothetical protein